MDEYTWISRNIQDRHSGCHPYPPVKRFADGHHISLVIAEPEDAADDSVVRVISAAVDRKTSGIIMAIRGDAAVVEAIDAAVEAGIPVITVEEDLPVSRRLAHVGTDWFRMGAVMAGRLAELTGGEGRVLMAANRSSANVYAAVSGFQYHLKGHIGLQLIGPRDLFTGTGWSERIQRHPEVTAVAAFDPESVFSLVEAQRIGDVPRSLTVIGAGHDGRLLRLVQSGQVSTLFLPRIEIATIYALELLLAHNREMSADENASGTADVPCHVDVGFDIITFRNVADFIDGVEKSRSGIVGKIAWISRGFQQFRRTAAQGTGEENQTAAILNAIPDLIFQLSGDGTFISYKAGQSEDLYKPPHEFLGKRIDDVLPPNVAGVTRQNINKVLAGEGIQVFEYELEIDGELRHFEARLTASGSDAVIAIVRNITDRKRAEEALRESEERFRVAFKTSPDSVTISRIEDGMYLDVNDGFMALTGYSRAEVLGKSALDLDMWCDHEDRRKLVRELSENGYITNLEAKFRVKDGSIRTALLSARIVLINGVAYILSVTRDIEDWVKAQEALRQSEERFRAVFETALDAIYIKDRELKYVAVNPSMAALFDIPPSEFIGKKYEDIFGSSDAEYNRRVEERVLNGEDVIEESVRSIAGRERTFHVIMVPMRNDNGDIVGICGIAREVTETRRLQEFAERARRLETAGVIAGQVAHDFNNLLGPLMAYPDIIRETLPDGSEVRQFLDDIEYAAEQMADINQQLLTLGRRGHYSREPFNLNGIIRQVLDRLPPPRKTIAVETTLAADLMNMVGGPAQIYRVIANLVTNAYDAMKDGGTLTVTTKNVYLDGRAGKYRQIPLGEYIYTVISDTGCGIPDDILPRIFDPFFTTRTATKKRGSGLGLSIIHSVIEDHHGFIDVESVPGEGTRFHVYLPVTHDDVESVEDRDIIGGNERLLIVDDDRVQLDVARTMLRRLGYSVIGVESGEHALELLAETTYDLLLIDMVIPTGIGGVEIYRRAVDLRPDQRAIMMSGFAESEQVKEALKLGADTFLKKPLALPVLAAAVRKALDKRVEKTTGT